jgi:hypothetical protein
MFAAQRFIHLSGVLALIVAFIQTGCGFSLRVPIWRSPVRLING